MKFLTPKCPTCNEPAKGTLERVYGIALLNFNKDGTAEYDGETNIDWDSQETVEDERGDVTLCCANGHEWQSRKER